MTHSSLVNANIDKGNSSLIDIGTGNVFNSRSARNSAIGKTKNTDWESLFEKGPTLMDSIPRSNTYKVKR